MVLPKVLLMCFDQVYVMSRVQENHPDVTKEDAARALVNSVRMIPRIGTDPLQYVGIGPDAEGNLLEFVAIKQLMDGREMWLVYHAQRPPQESVKRELGFMPGKREKDRSKKKRKGKKGSK